MLDDNDQINEKDSSKKETNKKTLSQIISQKYPKKNNSKSTKEVILNNYINTNTNALFQESGNLKEEKKLYFESKKIQSNELLLSKEKDDYAKQSQKRMDLMQAVLDDELNDNDIGGNMFRKKHKSKTCVNKKSNNNLNINENDKNEVDINNINEISINRKNLKDDINEIINNEKNENNENNQSNQNNQNNEINENYNNIESNNIQPLNDGKEITEEFNSINESRKIKQKTEKENFFNKNSNNNMKYEFTSQTEYNKEYINFNIIKKNNNRAKSANNKNIQNTALNKNDYKYKIIKGNSDNIFIDVYINSYNNKKIINNETPLTQKYDPITNINTKFFNSDNKYKSFFNLKLANKFYYPPTTHGLLKFPDKRRKTSTLEIEKKLNEIIGSLKKVNDFGERNLTTGNTSKKDFNYIGELNFGNKKNYIKEEEIFGDILNKNKNKKKYKRDDYIYKSNSCNYKSGIKDCNVITPLSKKLVIGNEIKEIQTVFNEFEKKRKSNSFYRKNNSMRNINYSKYQNIITNNEKEKHIINLISIGKRLKDNNINTIKKKNVFKRGNNDISHGIYFKERKKTAIYPVNPFEYDKNGLYL